MDTTNYIGRLYEFAQSKSLLLKFEDVDAVGPDNIKIFTVRAVLDGKAYANGTGKNKKEARQIAAKKALESVLNDPPPESTDTALSSVPPSPVQPAVMTNRNYMCWLNEYVHKNNVSIRAVESTNIEPTNAPQCCKFIVGDKEYPAAFGRNKKEVKEEAAKLVYCEMFGSEASQTADEAVSHALGGTGDIGELCGKSSELNVSIEDSSSTNKTDFASMVNQYCQRTKRLSNYIEVTPEGQSQKRFACRMVIDQQQYPVGEGMNKREARQMAAQLAWSVLQKQPDWDSKDESEITSTSEGASSLPESEFSDESAQCSSGSSWIQFKDSKSSPVQGNSSAQDSGLERKIENTLTKKTSRFTSEYDGDVELLANGSYGCVYKAKKLMLNKYCAIKEILTKDKDESLQEVMVLWELHHPNIVRYYTYWFQDTGFRWSKAKVLFIEMELCDGGTLRSWIQKKNKEPQENSRQKESLEFAGQILSGVEYIHDKKLIHRDLKPENILFGRDGKVRIGDFGLATQDNDEDEVMERTEDRGTRSYMAPEQFGVNYDRKVDIFALGLIFFELFWRISTGHERIMLWKDVRSQKLPKEFIGTYPIESHIIKTMLSNNPEDRPEARAVKSDLEKWTQTSEEDIDQKTV